MGSAQSALATELIGGQLLTIKSDFRSKQFNKLEDTLLDNKIDPGDRLLGLLYNFTLAIENSYGTERPGPFPWSPKVLTLRNVLGDKDLSKVARKRISRARSYANTLDQVFNINIIGFKYPLGLGFFADLIPFAGGAAETILSSSYFLMLFYLSKAPITVMSRSLWPFGLEGTMSSAPGAGLVTSAYQPTIFAVHKYECWVLLSDCMARGEAQKGADGYWRSSRLDASFEREIAVPDEVYQYMH